MTKPTDQPRNISREWDEIHAERDALREELAEWQSVNVAQVELRGLVESHMDMARGQWECVAEIERLRAALRQILEDPDAKILDSHRDDGWEALHV